MKKNLLFAAFALLLHCGAWQIDSSYTIVIPEKAVDVPVEKALLEGAEALQYALGRAGIKVGIKKSLRPVPGRKSIFLGFQDGRKRKHFNGSIQIRNRDIYLTGNDYPGHGKPARRNSLKIYYLGSWTALTVFMRDYLDCRFVLPCKEALKPLNMPQLPEKLDLEVKAPLEFGSGRWTPYMLFDYANANFGRGSTHVYGGHSHDKAIPQKKYGKSNPEYFSFAKGKRYSNIYYHGHCLSNPQVEELIYKNLLDRLDRGYEMGELGQSDGNIPCECKNCLAMPGGKDPGERLWQFHLKLAKRLEKDRPGKKALIICYWPNLDPPKTPKKLPANVTVELTRYDKEHFAKWRNYRVPGGFYIYIYNWGYYQPEGFTPKNCDPAFLEKQVRSFKNMGIKGLYRCGYWELPGLEGPAYYVYGQLWHRTNVSGEKLFEEYCTRVFGKAAPEMLKFYRLLYGRQKFDLLPEGATRWSHLLRIPRKAGSLAPNQALLAKRYPPQVLRELKSLLAKAFPKMTSPEAKWVRPYIEKEFRYLETTAQIANCMELMRKENSAAVGKRLLALIAERNKAVKSLSQTPHLRSVRSRIQIGGHMYAQLTFPYRIDAEYLLKNNVSLCERQMKVNSAPRLLVKAQGHSHPVRISTAADEKMLYVRFSYEKYSRSQLGEDKLNFYIESADKKLFRFQTWLTAKPAVFATEVLKNSTQNGGKMPLTKRCSNKGCRFTIKDDAQGKAVAEFAVPFSLLGGRPAPGSKRKFNASCLRYLPGKNKQDGIAFWEMNFGRLNWKQDMDRMGTLTF